jgi:hypothetical protein
VTVNANLEGTMKIEELKKMSGETLLTTEMLTTQLRRCVDETSEKVLRMKLMLADFTVLRRELKDHIEALEDILKVCEAVAQGRYLEDCQRCHWGEHHCEYQCTRRDEHCDSFDDRDPYDNILSWFEDDLVPFSAMLRHWITAQVDLQRKRREAMWGKDGLFGNSKLVMYQQDDDGVMRPMTDEESQAAMATRDAKEDTSNQSMAMRVDQYELNLQHIRRICRAKGDLREVAAIINDGLPPTIQQGVSLS